MRGKKTPNLEDAPANPAPPQNSAPGILSPQPAVRTHAATHMPLPPESCGHQERTPLGGDPGTNGLLTGNRSNIERIMHKPAGSSEAPR